MRFEGMTPEMVEKAKGRETAEERTAFIPGERHRSRRRAAGGHRRSGDDDVAKRCERCPKDANKKKCHKWEATGRKRSGTFFGWVWPDVEKRCAYCGKTAWS